MVYKIGFGIVSVGLLTGCMTLLIGCSMISDRYREFAPDRDTEYLEETADDPLVLPNNVVMLENYYSPYIIPEGPLPGPDAEPMNLVPPGGLPLWERANAQLAEAKARGELSEEEMEDD